VSTIRQGRLTNNRAAILFLLLASLACNVTRAQTSSPEIISFTATREGEFVFAEALVDLPVARAVAWAVLTDYEGYPRFISTMRESRILSRHPGGVVVQQKGVFGFLFFTQDIEATLLVSEQQPTSIVARAIEGSFRFMRGRYELQPSARGTRLTYSGRFLPEFDLPPLIGMSIVHHALQRNFTEMVEEIVRRDAASRRAGKGEE